MSSWRGTCSTCESPGRLTALVSPMGAPATYGWCRECERRRALPAWFVELRLGEHDWAPAQARRQLEWEVKRGWQVYMEGRYVPLAEFAAKVVERQELRLARDAAGREEGERQWRDLQERHAELLKAMEKVPGPSGPTRHQPIESDERSGRDEEARDDELEETTEFVTLEDAMDPSSTLELAGRVADLVRSGKTRIVIDLSGWAPLDSAARSPLIEVSREIESGGGALAFLCPDESVRKVFAITRLDERFAVYRSREEALAAARDPAEPA